MLYHFDLYIAVLYIISKESVDSVQQNNESCCCCIAVPESSITYVSGVCWLVGFFKKFFYCVVYLTQLAQLQCCLIGDHKPK